MADLTEILNHGWPGAAVRVRRIRAVYGESEDPDTPPPLLDEIDMWAGIEADDPTMQAALDWCVDWADGVAPPSAAEVRAAIAAAEAGAGAGRLAAARRRASAWLDGEAEAVRRQFITPGAGQALSYGAKRREAEAWAADAAPNPANYPWARSRAARLAGIEEGAVTAAQCQAVIDIWTARAAAWTAAGIAIEFIREGGKEAIAAAPDIASIKVALTGLDWPAAP